MNTAKVWGKVGVEARDKFRGKGRAGPRAPGRPFRPRGGVGVLNRVNTKIRGRVTGRAGAQTGAGRGAENEGGVRVVSRVKVRKGFTGRGCTEAQVGVRGRARGASRPGKEITDVPRGRSHSPYAPHRDRCSCP